MSHSIKQPDGTYIPAHIHYQQVAGVQQTYHAAALAANRTPEEIELHRRKADEERAKADAQYERKKWLAGIRQKIKDNGITFPVLRLTAAELNTRPPEYWFNSNPYEWENAATTPHFYASRPDHVEMKEAGLPNPVYQRRFFGTFYPHIAELLGVQITYPK